jgi:hypothetical protein
MVAQQTYQQLITEGIKGLPLPVLVEIADFVYFVRNRALQPKLFEEERQGALLRGELKRLSRVEESHLEREFEDYDRLYPRE